MGSVNAGDLISPYKHQQNRLRSSISLIFRILTEDAQTHAAELLRPVAVLACFSGGDQSMAFQRRGYRTSVSIENSFNELPSSICFATNPTSCSWGYMAFNTFDS